MNKVRVRFAPSPTGPLHIGGVRTALYNYLFAKKHGGDFLLRIEDTDQARYVAGAEDYIIDALNWCKIIVDEGVGSGGSCGPYRQSERKHIYSDYVDQLIKEGHAYYAFDTKEDLSEMREQMKSAGVPSPKYDHSARGRMKNSLTLSDDDVNKRMAAGEPYVIRVKMPRNKEIRINDLVRGWVTVNTNNLDDKVLFKSDGMPTYHLANVVDDHLMKISHVIRGEEWLPSAPLHMLLYEFFGWEAPFFAHLPLLLRPDGNGKLSKRDGDRLGFPVFPTQWTNPQTKEVSSGYREEGYFPEAFINMLVFLGWNPGTSQEIFSIEELINFFSLERVGKSGAKFDFDKTKWFNQQYLRSKNGEELAELTQIFTKEIPSDLKTLIRICELMKERATFPQDIWDQSQFFFVEPAVYDQKIISKKWKKETPAIMKELHVVLSNVPSFVSEKIETAFKTFLEEKDLSFGAVLPNFRLAITGLSVGPSMFQISEILGKKEVLKRIEIALEKIQV